MSRIKLNEGVRLTSRNSKPSDLYRKFSGIFNAITKSRNPFRKTNEYKKGYVNVTELEDDFINLLSSGSDSTIIFLGNIGIGKTTVLRYCYEGLKSKYFKKHNCLFVPFVFNPANIPDQEKLSSRFNGILSEASKIIANQSENISINEEVLSNFIRKNKGSLLESVTCPEEATDIERISQLRLDDRLAYELEKLKYVLTKFKINNILLILDDIEPLQFEIQKELIKKILVARECLFNCSYEHKFITSIIISLRPDTFDLINTQPDITPYTPDYITKFPSPIPLRKIFEARFEAASTDEYLSKIGNINEWERAMYLGCSPNFFLRETGDPCYCLAVQIVKTFIALVLIYPRTSLVLVIALFTLVALTPFGRLLFIVK